MKNGVMHTAICATKVVQPFNGILHGSNEVGIGTASASKRTRGV